MAYQRTITRAKAQQLENEIRSIPEFPQMGIQVYQQGIGALVVDANEELTEEQIQQLDECIANHVPDTSAEEFQAILDQLKYDIFVHDSEIDGLSMEDQVKCLIKMYHYVVTKNLI